MSDATDGLSARTCFLSRDGFAALFDVLHAQGYEVIGPTIDQEAIVYL